MGERSAGATIVVALIASTLVVPASAGELQTAEIQIVDPQRGERLTDGFTLAWTLETDGTVDAVDVRLESLCQRTDEIHVLADASRSVVPDGPQTIDVDPAVEGPSGGLPDCDDLQLRLFVVPSPGVDVVRDTISVTLDRYASDLDLQIEDYKQSEAQLTLSWTDRDGNEVPTVLTAIDAETGSVLTVHRGLGGEGQKTIDLDGTPLEQPWKEGDLKYRLECGEAVDPLCRPDEELMPDGLHMERDAQVQTRIETTPRGECEGPQTLQGTVEAPRGAVDAEEAVERVEVRRKVDGDDKTGGYVPADPGPDGRWSSFRYEFVCSDAGVHNVSVRPVYEGGIPDEPEHERFTLTPSTRGIYEDLSIERADASACDGSGTGAIDVTGSVSGVHLVEGLFAGEHWQPIPTVSDPSTIAEIAHETGVRFPAKADAAFRYRVDCPGPGTHKLKIRALTVADSTETWEKLFEIAATGTGGGIDLDVGAAATRVEDLPGAEVRAHFNAEALGTADRRGGLKQLSIDFEGAPDRARLTFDPDVEVPPVGGDQLIVGTFDLHLQGEGGGEIPVVDATLQYETTPSDLARARASFADPEPVLADREPDADRWRMVDPASVTGAGEGEVVRFEMTGADLFSPFAMTYGAASSADDPWSGPDLGDVMDGMSFVGQIAFVAVVGLVAVAAGVATARLVAGRRPPFG